MRRLAPPSEIGQLAAPVARLLDGAWQRMHWLAIGALQPSTPQAPAWLRASAWARYWRWTARSANLVAQTLRAQTC